MQFLMKFPIAKRVQPFFYCLDLWLNKASGNHPMRWVISMDRGDPQLDTPAIRKRLREEYIGQRGVDMQFFYNDGIRDKIDAVNANRKAEGEFEIGVLVSDDMHPVTDGYDEVIVQDMQKFYPDLFGALNYADGITKPHQKCCMLTIAGKPLLDWLGDWYYPGYKSVYADNELTHVCRDQLGVMQEIHRVIVKHNHGGDKRDPLAKQNAAYNNHDARMFKRRMARGFPSANRGPCPEKYQKLVAERTPG